ncbi:MAG: hypothetical protein ABL967_11200 [Bryobacteraceae bacterium]
MIRTIIDIGRIALCFLLVVGLVAQGQVALVSSDSAFILRGSSVNPSAGVPNWPLLPGDTIQAGQTPVTITFPDGSTVILAPGSSGRVGMVNGVPMFQLDSGTAHFTLKKKGAVVLRKAGNVVEPQDLVGEIDFGGNKPPAGWWTAKRTTGVVVGAAGAAALGIGLAQRNPSPSQ